MTSPQDDVSEEDVTVKEEVEECVTGIERLITDHNGNRLARWCSDQYQDIQLSSEIDRRILVLQQAAAESCSDAIGEELHNQSMERAKASAAAARYHDAKERAFEQELHGSGERYAETTAEIVRGYTSKVRTMGEAWDANAWDRLDRQLGSVSWQQARLVHATNPTAGVADVYSSGALNEYLQEEKEGW